MTIQEIGRRDSGGRIHEQLRCGMFFVDGLNWKVQPGTFLPAVAFPLITSNSTCSLVLARVSGAFCLSDVILG